MIIHIVANEGSPVYKTEQSIYGIDGQKGVGGAELGILTLCRLWHNAGHEVVFYNNGENGRSVFRHERVASFHPHAERDVVIIFRTPDERVRHAKGKKIFYSNDQYTNGEFGRFAHYVDKVVCISQFHSDYFKVHYNIHNAEVIDIPVRTWEYENITEKKQNSCLFSSVPDRGLLNLAPIWKHVVEQVPDATLTITGDWSLWNGMDYTDQLTQYRRAFAGMKNVNYMAAVSRQKFVDIQRETEFFLYPHYSDVPELFCISLAEAQVAGAIPVTSRIGAIETTNRFGYKIDGHPRDVGFRKNFVDTLVGLMREGRPLPDITENARKEFGAEKILAQWERIFDD